MSEKDRIAGMLDRPRKGSLYMTVRVCAEDGCESSDIVGWGYCMTCYTHRKNHGLLSIPDCPMEGCDNPRYRRGPCRVHRESLDASGLSLCRHPKCANPVQPVSEFFASADSPNGLATWCRTCSNRGRHSGGQCPIDDCSAPQWQRGPCLRHRDELHESGLRWCTHTDCARPLKTVAEFPTNKMGKQGLGSQCKECCSRDKKSKRKAKPDAATDDRELKYKTPQATLDAMLAAQGGGCATCGHALRWGDGDKKKRKACVDHDHACCPGSGSCGKCVRQILCNPCNIRLGWIEGDPIVKRAELERRVRAEASELIAYRDRWNVIMASRGVVHKGLASVATTWIYEMVEEVLHSVPKETA